MRPVSRCLLLVLVSGVSFLRLAAQCPDRPVSGTEVLDALNLTSQNGVLKADFNLAHSVDKTGFTHYCYKYQTPNGVAESPTLRLNPGDQLLLKVRNSIKDDDSSKMEMPAAGIKPCGDGGMMTVSSTNLHFHGMPIPPTCHQDDVIDTLIQPGFPGFPFDINVPADTPPGLYWYHPHVHGFTEFQVNGGAAGALVVEGMEKVRPEVTGLTERVFVIRQQYLVPWIPGPYQLSINYQVAQFPRAQSPIITMKPNERQFWRVANATLQDFMPIQVLINGVAEKLELIALDGYPLPATRKVDTILIPPAGRAEFIVKAPPAGEFGTFLTNAYSTGPTGNADLAQILANLRVSQANEQTPPAQAVKHEEEAPKPSAASAKLEELGSQAAKTQRKLYFSEEFGGTNGPIQFYITVDGQKQKVFEGDEKPVITTHIGAVEDWTIENRALETHAFHIHQIHFRVLEIDGKPAPHHDLLDTITIPYWEGKGPYHSVKLRMDFRDPTIAGTFLFHCHILLHEDLGMMHKILVEP